MNGLPRGMESYPIEFNGFPLLRAPTNSSFVHYNAYREECNKNDMEDTIWKD